MFPIEIWSRVMEYSDLESLNVMCYVSHTFKELAVRIFGRRPLRLRDAILHDNPYMMKMILSPTMQRQSALRMVGLDRMADAAFAARAWRVIVHALVPHAPFLVDRLVIHAPIKIALYARAVYITTTFSLRVLDLYKEKSPDKRKIIIDTIIRACHIERGTHNEDMVCTYLTMVHDKDFDELYTGMLNAGLDAASRDIQCPERPERNYAIALANAQYVLDNYIIK